ncbi:MAG: DUF1302 family protein, partial [Betaproteobacteria bacterium]
QHRREGRLLHHPVHGATVTGAATVAAACRMLRALCLAGILGFALAPVAVQAAQDEDEPPLAPPEAGPAGSPAGGRTEESAVRNALAQSGITGSLRAGFWSSNRRLDDETNISVASAWLKLDKKLESGIGLFAEGYLANEDVFGDRRDESRLREGYVEGRKGNFDYRVGKQIIAWGRTDRFNPTDNLTPRDATLLAGDIDEDRFGSLAAKASWNFNASTSLTGIWIPQFRPNVVPLPPRPGVTYQENVPDSSRQWALKLDQSGKAVDWSVSWFDGFDLSADVSPGPLTAAGQVVKLDHNRIKVLGADVATTRGSYRFALEGAYVRTEDPDGTDPGMKNPFLYGVFGVERDYPDNLTVIVQTFTRHVMRYSNPEDIVNPAARALAVQQAVVNAQYDRTQQGMSLRIDKKWFNETLEGEIAAIALLNRNGYFVRPRMIYLWTDSIKVIAGYEYFSGSDKTTYGLLEKNTTLYTEVRWYF